MTPVTTTQTAPTFTAEQIVKEFVKVRDRLAVLEEEFKNNPERKRLLETKDLLEGWLQQFLDRTKATSVKTQAGTAYVTVKTTASLADPQAFMSFVIERGKFELLDRRANANAVKDYVKENGQLPPGANLNTITSVNVRRG